MRKIIKFVRHFVTFIFIIFWLSFYAFQMFSIYYYKNVDHFGMTRETLFYTWAGCVLLLYLYIGGRQFKKFFEIGNRIPRKIEIILISLGWLLIYVFLAFSQMYFQGLYELKQEKPKNLLVYEYRLPNLEQKDKHLFQV